MELHLPPRIEKSLKEAVFDSNEITEAARKLVLKDQSLFFYGPPGSGKTLKACAIVKACAKMTGFHPEYSIQFVSVPQLLEDLRPKNQYSDNDLLMEAAAVDLLVLDDIGAEKSSEWANERLYLLINHRFLYIKPTIFTSNLSVREIMETSGDMRLGWRLAEMCVFEKFAQRVG